MSGYIVNFSFASQACSIPRYRSKIKYAANFRFQKFQKTTHCHIYGLKTLTVEFSPSKISVCTGRGTQCTCLVLLFTYTNSSRLLLELFGHYFDCEIRYSKHFPLQSSFLLCFVTTIVSISYFQSLIHVSALSSCLYMSPNRVEALMAAMKTGWEHYDQI